MSRAEICALVALAGSSNPAMQAKDPRPIVEAWSLMLGDLDCFRILTPSTVFLFTLSFASVFDMTGQKSCCLG